MITIKMHQKKWRILLGNEIWQFENIDQFAEVLEALLIIKEKYGKLEREW